MPTCETCKFFAPLSPGHAAICFEKWRHLKWNDAVPLTAKDNSCEKHETKFPAPDMGHIRGAADSHVSQDSLPAGRPTNLEN